MIVPGAMMMIKNIYIPLQKVVHKLFTKHYYYGFNVFFV